MPEISHAKLERPSDEMQRLIRLIAGKRGAGEKDQQLIGRAQARLNRGLSGNDMIGPRRASGYWYAEYAEIPSIHMDRVRELAFAQPIEEAFDALQAAEQYLDSIRQRLLDRALGLPRDLRGQHRDGAAGARAQLPAGDRELRHSPPAVLGLLTSSSLARGPSAT